MVDAAYLTSHGDRTKVPEPGHSVDSRILESDLDKILFK